MPVRVNKKTWSLYTATFVAQLESRPSSLKGHFLISLIVLYFSFLFLLLFAGEFEMPRVFHLVIDQRAECLCVACECNCT